MECFFFFFLKWNLYLYSIGLFHRQLMGFNMLETCSVFKGNLLLFTDSFGKAIVKMRSISCCFLNLWSFLFHSQFSTTLNSMKFILTLLFFMGFELSLCMYFSKTCNPGQNILNKLKKQRGIGHDDHYYFWKGDWILRSITVQTIKKPLMENIISLQ